jgi:5-methylcytosine-specific restriction endonuclease McrA
MPTINRRQFNISYFNRCPAGDYDREKQLIYNTRAWRKIRLAKLVLNPICENCGLELSTQVHHIESFMKHHGQERRAFGLNPANLQALCANCHSRLHGEMGRGSKKNQQIAQTPSHPDFSPK